jgi:hypothetical protein
LYKLLSTSFLASQVICLVLFVTAFTVFRNVGRGWKADKQWWADTADAGWADTWWADTWWADTWWADTWWADKDTGPGRTQQQAMKGSDRENTDCQNFTVNYLFL